MSEELRPCPFCGSEVQDDPHTGENYPRKSPMGGWIIHCECCGASLSQFRKSGKGEISWNTRPIEDALQSRIAELKKDLSNKEIEYTDLWDDALALQARIAELEGESERLSQLLHDEMSQLEIATDLGNKRWTALQKISENGEKHNTNWCKRVAQEGLGLK